jgi:hypothetical protein
LPGAPIELGDYGIMDGNIFIHMGKLKNDFEAFAGDVIQLSTDPTKDLMEFKSESGVDVNFMAKGSVNAAGTTLAKAALEIKFSEKDAVFFNAADCTTTRIANKAKVGDILMQMLEDKK